jgi:hypothetical protein
VSLVDVSKRWCFFLFAGWNLSWLDLQQSSWTVEGRGMTLSWRLRMAEGRGGGGGPHIPSLHSLPLNF